MSGAGRSDVREPGVSDRIGFDTGRRIGMASGPTWRADDPRFVRRVAESPRIQLLFHEYQRARTQEFVLRWSSDSGQSYREIVRQQYNFSPPDTTRELEDYVVDLAGVTVIELRIVPDITGGDAAASIEQFRIA